MTKDGSDPFLTQFISLAGDVAEMVSLNRSVGQLYGLLYISTAPMSLEELAHTCKMSKGNASIHLRILESWNAAHPSSQPGTRKDYYVANRDLKSVISQRFRDGVAKRLGVVRHRFAEMEKDPTVSAHLNRPENAHWKKKLSEADRLMNRVEKAMPFVMRLMGGFPG